MVRQRLGAWDDAAGTVGHLVSILSSRPELQPGFMMDVSGWRTPLGSTLRKYFIAATLPALRTSFPVRIITLARKSVQQGSVHLSVRSTSSVRAYIC